MSRSIKSFCLLISLIAEGARKSLFISQKNLGKFSITMLLPLVFCVLGQSSKAQTSIYVFDPNQSTVVQTGGFAGVHETYPVEGQFRLSVDFDTGFASFEMVDANLLEPTGFLYTENLDELYNMTELTGIVLDNTTIVCVGKVPDGPGIDTIIILIIHLMDDSVYISGETIPPDCCDFFYFDLDAVAQKKYGGGTGEPNNPYLIYNAEQMNKIGAEPNDWDKHFKLMADIDLSAYTGTEFNIIGVDRSNPFTGVFDGNEHTMCNFTYTTTVTTGYIGLFGCISHANAIVENLTLTDPNINAAGHSGYVGSLVGCLGNGMISGCKTEGGGVSGYDIIGGLAGLNFNGEISNCSATVHVWGVDDRIGGLVGENCHGEILNCFAAGSVWGLRDRIGGLVGTNSGTISSCYATGNVSGYSFIGGLVGYNFEYITNVISNCYATGNVSGDYNTGGLVGGNYNGTILASFWDIETSGQTISSGGTGLTTAEMQTADTFLDAGWDFVGETANGTEDIWWILEGQDYPRLWWEQHKYGGGTGEPNDPYQIATADDLMLLGDSPEDYDKHFILTADIDLDPNLPGRKVFNKAVIAPDTNDGELFFQGTSFTGNFNGDKHAVKNLTINEDATEYLGLFGYISSNGQVKNLNLESIFITGSSRIGGLAGYNSGSIINCSATGNIFSLNEGWSMGGLVGTNIGSISNCQANAYVKGGDNSQALGGLVGSLSSGSINNSSASGIVSARQESAGLGGLVGTISYGDIKYSYATGNVTRRNGSGSVGGFAGRVEYSNISQCYSSVRVTGNDTSKSIGGFVGRSSSSTITNCYATGAVSGYIRLGGFIGYLGIGSKIKNCYAVGWVYSNINSPFTGGMFGETARNYVWINQCFWDVETSSLSTSAAGTGLTTAQMQNIETYHIAGWDMAGDRTDGTADIWKMPESGGYPELTIFTEDYEPHILAGAGTPENPYQIATPEDLGAIFRYNKSSYYKLTNDMDLSGITWATAPIPAFDGIFDGNGHKITNLTIHVSTTDSKIGLFGSNNGCIKNLALENFSITAEDDSRYLGGLVGSCYGDIICCYVTGNISGANGNRYIGGLVGDKSYCDVIYCYSKCNISLGSNAEDIGGLVGYNLTGTITQCFASGSIISGESSINLGGLVGSSSYAEYSVKNCFWDVDISGLSESDGGEGLTTAQMQDPNVFMDAGWDFVNESDGPSDIWARAINEGHPILWWQLPVSQRPLLPSFSGGTGETNDPYLISTADELNSIGYNPRLVESHFKLIDDINLANVKFYIIGNEAFPFSGIFDGDGYSISNFNYTSSSKDYIGLFEYVEGPYAEIKNLGLMDPNVVAIEGVYLYINSVGSLIGRLENGKVTNCYVQGGSISGSGNYYVGGLVGLCYGEITDCRVTSTVTGTELVGGLSGGGNSIITNCRTACNVSGTEYIGGLLGNNSGIITRCTSSCTVSGSDRIGGLLGGNSGEVTCCYSLSDVLSTGTNVGGLVGDNTGIIIDSYATGSTSGNSIVGGLVGSNGYINTRDLYWEYPGEIYNCYSTGNVSGNENVGGLLGYNVIGNISNSFWDIQTSGQTKSAGGTGKTTAEMQTESTFTDAGWDFVSETANGTEDIWWILEGQDYPRLWWETIENIVNDPNEN